jgi:hypothetical protein
MKRLIGVIAFLLLALFGPQASAQFNGCPPGFCNQSSASPGSPPSLDGSALTSGFGGPKTLSLTTTQANDIIIVDVIDNSCSGGTSAVSDAASLSWTKRAGGTGIIQEWWALSVGILTADTITLSCSAGGGTVAGAAFGVNNANTTSPFDPNGAIPVIGTSSAVAISTTNSNTFMFATYNTASLCTPAAGWTTIVNNTSSVIFIEYQTATTPQTAASAGFTVCSPVHGIGDAITH